MLKPCSWCQKLTSKLLVIEKRSATFTANTPSGRLSVKANREVPCCDVCRSALIPAQKQVEHERGGQITGQMDVYEVLREME